MIRRKRTSSIVSSLYAKTVSCSASCFETTKRLGERRLGVDDARVREVHEPVVPAIAQHEAALRA